MLSPKATILTRGGIIATAPHAAFLSELSPSDLQANHSGLLAVPQAHTWLKNFALEVPCGRTDPSKLPMVNSISYFSSVQSLTSGILKYHFLFWLCHTACRIVVLWPRIETMSLAVKMRSQPLDWWGISYNITSLNWLFLVILSKVAPLPYHINITFLILFHHCFILLYSDVFTHLFNVMLELVVALILVRVLQRKRTNVCVHVCVYTHTERKISILRN